MIEHVPWQGLYMVCKSRYRWKSQKWLKNETIKSMPYYLYIACLLHSIPLIMAICNTAIEIIIQISNHLGGCFKVSFSHRHPLIVIIYTKQSYHASTWLSLFAIKWVLCWNKSPQGRKYTIVPRRKSFSPHHIFSQHASTQSTIYI